MATDLLNPNTTASSQGAVGVKRVNNWPLIIMGAAFGVFLLIIMLVAADRAEQQKAFDGQKTSDRAARDSSALAREIVSGHESGYIDAAEIVPLTEELPTEIAAAQTETVSPEVADIMQQADALPINGNDGARLESEVERELRRRIEQSKIRALENAITARTGVNLQTGGSSLSSMSNRTGGGVGNDRNSQLAQLAEVQRQLKSADALLSANSDPMQIYQSRLAAIKSSGLTGSPASAASTPALLNKPKQEQSGYSQFEGTGGDRWTLDSSVDAPQTPYVLRAGFVVPGIMISGVNSDLPGQLMAQVSQDVYDTATGQHLLIPQGSRLVGQYASAVAYGQERVMVAWQRIVFPDGKAMDIGAMQGADGAGYAGFADKVNHHFWRIFGSAFLMSVVTAAVELSQDNGNQSITESRRAGDALSEALGQQLGQATAQMIMRNLNIAPTIEIRPGYRFNIMVSKDMVFSKPYQSFDY